MNVKGLIDTGGLDFTTELWAIWPDGERCERCDLEYMGHKSGDYEVVKVLDYDEEGEPSLWVPRPAPSSGTSGHG